MTTQHRTLPSTSLAAIADWFTSSYSGNGNNCVEMADLSGTALGTVAVRDSKDASGPVLMLSPGSFAALVSLAREH